MALPGPRRELEGFKLPIGWTKYSLLAVFRYLRVQRPATALLGPQYRAAPDLLEMDVTYKCDLGCPNCNRSCRQAPSQVEMDLRQVESFVASSRKTERHWSRVRLLGGEPTLHKHIREIIRILLEGLGPHGTRIELATNGYGQVAEELLAELPDTVSIENSHKTGPSNPHFRPFNHAPRDYRRYTLASYSNLCHIPQVCGMGMTPFGFYMCAIAGGIDRVMGLDIGRKEIPDPDDDFNDQAEQLCSLCGRFLDGHFIPHNFRRALTGESWSQSWSRLYASHEKAPPSLTPCFIEPSDARGEA